MLKEVTTSSGFVCKVEENAFDDMEVLELFADLSDNAVLSYPALIKKILTPEDKKRLYDHLRGEDGRVPVDAFGNEFSDIMAALTNAKK